MDILEAVGQRSLKPSPPVARDQVPVPPQFSPTLKRADKVVDAGTSDIPHVETTWQPFQGAADQVENLLPGFSSYVKQLLLDYHATSSMMRVEEACNEALHTALDKLQKELTKERDKYEALERVDTMDNALAELRTLQSNVKEL
ncbi:hypothetical protein CJ030_MR7G009313 [Morella rubra]|uniref:Uncharacterized protein n=1 Tax=Morella rubra TaxID=262757 RepID=A0A6A1V073_9ROSI|nr:hypothetical protein CJ030_MR7G016902 [Morella rubra]KAB1206084.1 hypothetical protein CJ030_MR7G009313 [Morella rubra]